MEYPIEHYDDHFIVYNCRSSSEWRGDMALSVTHSHDSRSTTAVIYGCPDSIRDEIINRLTQCNNVVHHPLAIPTIFCDVERNRHFNLVEPVISKLVDKALKISKRQRWSSMSSKFIRRISTGSTQSTEVTVETEDLMKLWLQVSDLKRGLETWKQQLEQLITHCEDLDRGATQQSFDELEFLESGRRIRQRLIELKCEYDEKIRQCAHIIDGMVLAAQLVCSFLLFSFFPTNIWAPLSFQGFLPFLPFPVKLGITHLTDNEDALGMEQHWTSRHRDQFDDLKHQHVYCQSHPRRFSTDAIHIVSYHGVLASYIRCGKYDQ